MNFTLLGHVLPIDGSLCYNPIASKLVCASDCSNLGHVTTEPLIPFLSYPINKNTGKPQNAQLPAVERRGDLRFNAPVFDPNTGLSVPICAVTMHPETGVVHPVGE